mmetsp:Transcript_25487/g.83908  ORF Transcript_25487/g.83908 Transcript_25487/m.83908 type:complete len:187 (-) Transcript_25487:2241-2801(-)
MPVFPLLLISLLCSVHARRDVKIIRDEEHFNSLLQDGGACGDFCVVELFSAHCTACKAMEPLFTELAQKFSRLEDGPRIGFAKIDLTKPSGRFAGERFRATSIPVVLLFRSGQSHPLANFSGAPQDVKPLQAFVLKHVGDGETASSTMRDLGGLSTRVVFILLMPTIFACVLVCAYLMINNKAKLR